ncbi:MAG: heavy-metal-associated domain-containing protein, partial [Gemmatimonadetes bacterium]|nr:heavy-metal-associated domain-containing protein [Gemmatimonadota bacterium]
MSESVQTREREGATSPEAPDLVVPAPEPEVDANERLRLRVTGMSCAGCAMSVEKALEKVPGVVGAV